MDITILNHILYELSLSISGEQNLEGLVKKAASAFLKKLDSALVSILKKEENFLNTVYIIPGAAEGDSLYSELVDELSEMLAKGGKEKFFIIKKDLYYYGFPLPGFGLLLIGKNDPLEEMFLKELLPITNMLARNCFFNLDAVRQRLAIEAELKIERHLLRVIIDSIRDPIIYKGADGIYQVVNKATEKFFSLLPEEIAGCTDEDLHSSEEAAIIRETDRKVLETGLPECYEAQFKNHLGHPVPFEVMKFPVCDAAGGCIGTVAVCRDITKRKSYEHQLEYLSAHDQLTGLYNRRFLKNELLRRDEQQLLPISIIMGDLNGLKLVNDVFGHQEGDNLLIKAAEIIRASCNKDDLIARWGGDEFVILLPQTGLEAAKATSRRIRKKCSTQKFRLVPVSIALGWAVKTQAEEDVWQILKEAGDRMYSDKFLHDQNYKETVINVLQSALWEECMETKEHGERLKVTCREIGERTGLSSQQQSELELLAMLHDIGKVAVDRGILAKPGPLSDKERQRMRRHVETGYRLARAVPEWSSIAEYILSHHERWDGRGYPRGLKGEEIPLLSRILAVAHIYDALITKRSYRRQVSRKRALAILKRKAGKQLDPEVIDIFCRLVTFEEKSIEDLE